MTFDGHGGGFGWFGNIASSIIGGLLTLFLVLVLIGVLFLLIRFLLVATTAATIYVARHSPPRAAPEPPSSTPPSDPTRPTDPTAPTEPIG